MKEGKKDQKPSQLLNTSVTANDLSMCANQSQHSADNSFINKSMLSYQVGDVGENGFVSIGIVERKRGSKDLNRTMVDKHGSGNFSDAGSDYSSSEEQYSSGMSEGHQSKYKKSLDFLMG